MNDLARVIVTLRSWGYDAAVDLWNPAWIAITYRRPERPSGDGRIMILESDVVDADHAYLAGAIRRAGGRGVMDASQHGTPTHVVHRFGVEVIGEQQHPDGDADGPPTWEQQPRHILALRKGLSS